jgi:arginine decarboxylase
MVNPSSQRLDVWQLLVERDGPALYGAGWDRARYATPFFDALRAYAAFPVGQFHALPVARGASIFNSRSLQDMGDFYGRNIFMAETSLTSGGLDSLLDPHGALRDAMDKAADTWNNNSTFFVTNGTSTANKIVVQSLTRPGDIVLIDRTATNHTTTGWY